MSKRASIISLSETLEKSDDQRNSCYEDAFSDTFSRIAFRIAGGFVKEEGGIETDCIFQIFERKDKTCQLICCPNKREVDTDERSFEHIFDYSKYVEPSLSIEHFSVREDKIANKNNPGKERNDFFGDK